MMIEDIDGAVRACLNATRVGIVKKGFCPEFHNSETGCGCFVYHMPFDYGMMAETNADAGELLKSAAGVRNLGSPELRKAGILTTEDALRVIDRALSTMGVVDHVA